MAILAPAEAPRTLDAAAAAGALIAAGAVEVLLFGSVADGTATADSDIDLVAIFADLDYADRDGRRRALEAAAREVVGYPVQVHVTDRPEWQARVQRVSSSFEARIAATAVPIAAAAAEGPVDWDKEMVLPMSDSHEALRTFDEWVLPALEAVANDTRRSITEEDPAASIETQELARLDRMVRVCAAAATSIETSLEALAVLYATPTPTKGDLQHNGHKIRKSLTRLERDVREPAAGAVRDALQRHNVDIGVLSTWREQSTYPDDLPATRGEADRLVPAYVVAAASVAAVLALHLQHVLGDDNPTLAGAAARWDRLAERIAAWDVRRGLPNCGPGVDL